MKKLMILALAMVANLGFAQTASTQTDLAEFRWATSIVHDFGKIKQGVPVTHEFKFTNKGKVPLLVTNAQPSCGCTTPSWTREPVMPGGSGYIKVTYNAAAPNMFDKIVTLTANVEGGVVTLHIKGEVMIETVAEIKPN